MINKSTKNALYAGILMESSMLLKEEEASIQSGIQISEPEDENQIRTNHKNTILNFQRIRNNAFIMLLRNGNLFYTDADNWKNSKKLYLSINGDVFELDIQNAKTLLAGDAEKILDKSFSTNRVNNEINLMRAEHFNFEDYKGDMDSSAIGKPNTKMGREDKKEPVKKLDKKQEIQKEQLTLPKNTNQKEKEQCGIQEKPKEQKKDLQERKLSNKPVTKEIKSHKKDKKERKIPVVTPDYDMDEFFMDEEEPVVTARPIQETTLKPEEKIPSVEEKQQEPEEISILDDSDLMSMKIPIDTVESLVDSVSVEELIMDTYIIKMKNEEDHSEKTFTIIVAPIKNTLETDAAFAPTFSFAKIEKSVCNGVSPNQQRLSYQIGIGGESFMVRGSWNENGFSSLLYPQNLSEHNMTVTKKQIKPVKARNIGHNITQMENGIRIHVLPLSSKNGNSGRVGILACLEDPIEDVYVSASTKDSSYVDIAYNKRIYRISAKWENKKLISSIQMI